MQVENCIILNSFFYRCTEIHLCHDKCMLSRLNDESCTMGNGEMQLAKISTAQASNCEIAQVSAPVLAIHFLTKYNTSIKSMLINGKLYCNIRN